MTEHENDDLVRDGDAWEQLERMAGVDPTDLHYPPDLGARIERMGEENGDELYEGIKEWAEVDRPRK